MIHPQECGPCPDCTEAVADYATIPAYRDRFQASPYWFEDLTSAGTFARPITFGYGRATTSEHGKVISIPPATPKQLERHRKLFGKEGVHLPDENRTAAELRDAGMSIREIARVRGISESRVKAQLRIAA